MNTMIYSGSGSSVGIGFAVPVQTVRKVVPQIIETGSARQVGLGIRVVDDTLARRAGITGVVIESVQAGGPAEAAGLAGLVRSSRGVLPGDVIVAIDGVEIATYDDLYNTLDGYEAGDVVRVGLVNDGAERTVEIGLVVLQ